MFRSYIVRLCVLRVLCATTWIETILIVFSHSVSWFVDSFIDNGKPTLEPTLNFFAVVNTLGALQCLLTAVALFSIRSGNRTANRFLAFNLMSLAIIIVDFVMYDTRFFLLVPRLYSVLDPFVLLIGPFFFLYVKSLTNPEFRFGKKDAVHLLLFALLALLLFPTVFENPEIKLQSIRDEISATQTTTVDYVIKSIVNLQVLGYFIASWLLLNRSITQNLPVSSQDLPVNVRWLRNLIIAVLAVSLLSAIFDYVENDYNNYVTPFLLTLIVYSMGYVGVRQSEIFASEKLFGRGKKYEKSVLTDEMAEEILSKLEHLMEKEQSYRDSLISLPGLAEKLKITTHLLSQVLNERLNRNFFNFVSEYRVAEAKRRLLDPEARQATMLEMAYDIGFNSLSAFNTAFKKHAGMSPTEFKKQNNQG